ncbi:MAG TPA: hypothetical protein VGN42_02720 [Pirellulales bacterium]|jgi:hypothetical protein|nr:hypothetical protein [Pirellulales bacterium]
MKYALILILACLPLVALTGWSFVEALGADEQAGVAAQDARLAEARQAAAGSAAEVAADGPLLRELAKTNLLASQPRALPSVQDDRLASAADAWRRSERARGMAMKYLAMLPPPIDENASAAERKQAAQDASKRLRAFLADERDAGADQTPGADAFLKLLAERTKQLQGEIAQYQRQDNVASALAEAAEDLNRGRYDDCLAVLASDPLGGIREGDAGERIQALRKRAEYRQAADELQSRPSAGEADRELYQAIDAFLRRRPTPPSPAEASLKTQLIERRDALKLAIAIADLADPPDLETLLAQAAAIFEQPGVERATRERVRAHVLDWLLTRGFPRLLPPSDLLGKQEAITKNAQRKIGIFLLPTGAEQWRFWANRQNRELRPRGDEQIARDSFEQPPATPRYVAWAQQYNDVSAKLVRQGGSQGDWRGFAQRCDAWEQELTAYRETWGVAEEPDRSCREWSFLGAAATARTLVDRWRQFEQVLGKSS